MCSGLQLDWGCNKYNNCNQSLLACHKHGILGCLLGKYRARLVRQEDRLLEGRCLGDHRENHLDNHLENLRGFLTDCRRRRKENHLSMWQCHHRVLDLCRESRGLRSQ